ncbi:MAG: hypothetical protein RBT36_01460 [Desulfobulbus sp.]|jgi:hypothetical protein|nr:hypothetical protein [Desulfobulbus sp.]
MILLNQSRDGAAAWQQAWRLRCCPPDHLLVVPPVPQLNEHLTICPWCRTSLDAPACPFPGPVPALASAAAPLQPGQVRAVRATLGDWGPKSRYYNPPAVLVLDLSDSHSVFVCQVYGDNTLAGPEDIPLGNDLVGFAEPWNTFTLMQDDLDTLLGEADLGVAAAVLEQRSQPEPALQPGSLLWFFRQMEVETGYFFARLAVSRLVAAHDREAAPAAVPLDPDRVQRALERLPLRFMPPVTPPATPLDLLAWATADERLLPLAAADPQQIHALVFTVVDGDITSVVAESLALSSCEYTDGVLTITGTSPATNSDGHCHWLFWWQAGHDLVGALPGQSGWRDGVFWAAFALTPEQADRVGHLVVRLLCPATR